MLKEASLRGPQTLQSQLYDILEQWLLGAGLGRRGRVEQEQVITDDHKGPGAVNPLYASLYHDDNDNLHL